MFNNRKTGQKDPRHVEKDDCGKRLFCGCPNQGDAGDDGEDIKPPELLAEKQARKDDGNLGGETPSLYGVYFCPILSRRHGLYCRNDFPKKHVNILVVV